MIITFVVLIGVTLAVVGYIVRSSIKEVEKRETRQGRSTEDTAPEHDKSGGSVLH